MNVLMLSLVLGQLRAADAPDPSTVLQVANQYLVVMQYGLRVEENEEGKQRLVMSEAITEYLDDHLPTHVFAHLEGTFPIAERCAPKQGRLVFMTDAPGQVIASLFSEADETRRIFKTEIILVTKEAYDQQRAKNRAAEDP